MNITFAKGRPYTPLMQLLNVLPSQSGPFLPEPYRELMVRLRLRARAGQNFAFNFLYNCPNQMTPTGAGGLPPAPVLPAGLRDGPQRETEHLVRA